MTIPETEDMFLSATFLSFKMHIRKLALSICSSEYLLIGNQRLFVISYYVLPVSMPLHLDEKMDFFSHGLKDHSSNIRTQHSTA